MGFGSKPKRQLYEEQSDTPWITNSRELMQNTYDNINYQLPRIDVMNDETKAGLNSYIDDIYNRASSDFDRNYNQTMNRYLQRDYNRFGTTGASNSLLNRDNYNLTQQRKLADLAYDKASTYNDFLNSELQRRYNNLNTNYTIYGDSGKTIQNFDNANWQIRNANKDVQYLNDIQDYNSDMGLWNTVGNLVSAGLNFVPGVGPALGMIGSAVTNSLTSPITTSGTSGFGIFNNGQGFNMPSRYQNWNQVNNGLWSMYGDKWKNSLNNNSNNKQLFGDIIPLSSIANSLYNGSSGSNYYGLGTVVDPNWSLYYGLPTIYNVPSNFTLR